MAIYLNNNVGVKLATAAAPTVPSIDISSYVSAVTLTQIVDELEVTSMGDSAHKVVAGLQSATLQIDFFNDWAASAGYDNIECGLWHYIGRFNDYSQGNSSERNKSNISIFNFCQ